jgi:hypothetical protein
MKPNNSKKLSMNKFYLDALNSDINLNKSSESSDDEDYVYEGIT